MRLLPIVASLALAASITAPALAKRHSPMTPMPMAGGSSMSGGAMTGGQMQTKTCPPGKHWVKGYTRNGKLVNGYCMKNASGKMPGPKS